MWLSDIEKRFVLAVRTLIASCFNLETAKLNEHDSHWTAWTKLVEKNTQQWIRLCESSGAEVYHVCALSIIFVPHRLFKTLWGTRTALDEEILGENGREDLERWLLQNYQKLTLRQLNFLGKLICLTNEFTTKGLEGNVNCDEIEQKYKTGNHILQLFKYLPVNALTEELYNLYPLNEEFLRQMPETGIRHYRHNPFAHLLQDENIPEHWKKRADDDLQTEAKKRPKLLEYYAHVVRGLRQTSPKTIFISQVEFLVDNGKEEYVNLSSALTELDPVQFRELRRHLVKNQIKTSGCNFLGISEVAENLLKEFSEDSEITIALQRYLNESAKEIKLRSEQMLQQKKEDKEKEEKINQLLKKMRN